MERVARKTFLKERLDQDEVKKFLTFPDEELILAAREHAAQLLMRLFQSTVLIFFADILFTFLSYFIFRDVGFSFATFMVIALMGNALFIREVVHWYFHLYIITTRKIVEVKYNPLFSEISNSVLLDQLRCTEIDAEMYGFVYEFLDLGNVAITFDRPTHQEEFVLKGIRSPRKVANYLSSHLHNAANATNANPQQVWLIPRGSHLNTTYGALHN